MASAAVMAITKWSIIANRKMHKNGNPKIVQFRLPKPALGNGRVQRTARYAFMHSDLVGTGSRAGRS